MIEKKSGLSKNDILNALSLSIKRCESASNDDESGIYVDLMNKYTLLAKDMGATEFEITDAWFSGKREEDRQNLFEVYCEKLWHYNEDFESFEDLKKWTEVMIKIRDKYNLADPLKIENELKNGDKNSKKYPDIISAHPNSN
ncbi:hypothetical protein A2Z67_02125 [Candidatus Woesebacteria bacterium RBG_13_36_22]|uniref:Uncharacterized protein n=1 Tax=Candidatus Woesebacteria bacterium RBG_13_36_22 TaxID=1802478 RepID=A0A1F7X2H3_9BACT|nr:MAG: hypothetical protein A2Z67_02125 [Candidatus Woesebacteria bacterium RBG_13_36_22]